MSTNPRIYLDHNATTPLIPAARAAIASALGTGGNPSSVHADGRAARDLVERARDQVAALAGRPREQVVFTSGGTEANALGMAMLADVALARGLPNVVAAAAIDHPSLQGAVAELVARGWTHRRIAVTADGALIREPLEGVGLVALSAVNHELGTVADLAAWSAAARAVGMLVHVDAVQAAGKLDLGGIDADTFAISAHKIGGPPGSGALVAGIDESSSQIEHGHQERGRRPGTENVLGIVGFGAAAQAVDPDGWASVGALGERLERGLLAIDRVRINGAGARRIGGTISAGFAGTLGESIVIALDLAGVSVSTGAACTSGSIKPSPVLIAIGQTAQQAREAVRFSLGRGTTADEIDRVLALLPAVVARARAASSRT